MPEPYSVVVQTGIAGLFEICFEQSWKMMKALLEEHGRYEERIGSPRAIIKLAYQCGMISDCDGWLVLLDTRNILSHTYSEEQAHAAIVQLKNGCLDLFDALKSQVEENWL